MYALSDLINEYLDELLSNILLLFYRKRLVVDRVLKQCSRGYFIEDPNFLASCIECGVFHFVYFITAHFGKNM